MSTQNNKTSPQNAATTLVEKDLNQDNSGLLEVKEPSPVRNKGHVTRCSQLFDHSEKTPENRKDNSALKFSDEKIQETDIIESSQVPVFHELSVPFFGVTPIQIEQALLQFVADLISRKSMHPVRHLFFIPVGLPGMGKSTLAKHIRQAVQNNLQGGLSNGGKFEPNFSQKSFQDTPSQQQPISGGKRDHASAFGEEPQLRANIINGKVFPDVDFKKISYDRILGTNVNEYAKENPDTPFHEIIDIIRAKADQDYLDQISAEGSTPESHQTDLLESLSQSNLTRNRINNWGSQNRSVNLPKSIIYCDRNNTPDVWADIRDTILKSNTAGLKDYRTVVLLPKQEPWDKTLYRMRNPICPHLIFECCKRIFSRKEHGCLSGANKPKAVEVVLKFAKLHDGFDFDDHVQIKQYFDDVLTLDFMKYSERAQPLLPQTIEGMIRGYNETPENFGVPSDETLKEVIQLIDEQIEKDFKDEAEAKALREQMMTQNGLLVVKQPSNHEPRQHGSTQKWLSPRKDHQEGLTGEVSQIASYSRKMLHDSAEDSKSIKLLPLTSVETAAQENS